MQKTALFQKLLTQKEKFYVIFLSNNQYLWILLGHMDSTSESP